MSQWKNNPETEAQRKHQWARGVARNQKTTKWQIKTPPSFQVDKSEGILEVGQVEQLIFHFKPAEARKYREELVLYYDSFEATVPTLGEAHNDNVYLSKTQITADPTSITLFSH